MNKKNNPGNLQKKLLRSKYESKGFSALSETELTALILSYSTSGDLIEQAELLLHHYGSFSAITSADINTLQKKFNLNDRTAVLLKMIPQLSRIYLMEVKNIKRLSSSSEAKKYFENLFIDAFEEELIVVCTDDNFNILCCKTIFNGSVSSVSVPCRKIADLAIQNSSSKIFIAHNHPLGNAEPSASDYSATNFIYRTLVSLGINLIDHIIVGKDSVISMQELPFSLSFNQSDSFGYIVNKAEE